MWYVYLLQSTLDRGYYIGYTQNIQQRFLEHNAGKTRSIKNRLPMVLIYFESYTEKTLAIKREHELKHNSFRKKELLDRFKKE